MKTKQQVDKHAYNTQGHSQSVSEEAVGLAGSAELAVVERMAPVGTTCAKSTVIIMKYQLTDIECVYVYTCIYVHPCVCVCVCVHILY